MGEQYGAINGPLLVLYHGVLQNFRTRGLLCLIRSTDIKCTNSVLWSDCVSVDILSFAQRDVITSKFSAV